VFANKDHCQSVKDANFPEYTLPKDKTLTFKNSKDNFSIVEDPVVLDLIKSKPEYLSITKVVDTLNNYVLKKEE
jgi:hypothetical protein